MKTHLQPEQTHSDVTCDIDDGLICKTSAKGKLCQDFEIRVYCDCENKTLEIKQKKKKKPRPIVLPIIAEGQVMGFEGQACDPLKPNVESPRNCYDFFECQEVNNGPVFVIKTCGPSMYYNPVTMVCDWPYSVREIKPECLNATTTTELPAVKVLPEAVIPPPKPGNLLGEETPAIAKQGVVEVSESKFEKKSSCTLIYLAIFSLSTSQQKR